MLKIAEAAKAVVFYFKDPLRVIEWLRPPDGGNGLDAWKHWLLQYKSSDDCGHLQIFSACSFATQ
jgi:hypothetical protein